MKDETRIVTAGRHPESNDGVVNPPVYHASTILYADMAERDAHMQARIAGERTIAYGRGGTATHHALEDAITALEGGGRCKLYPSGLAAVATVLSAYVGQGDHVLMTDAVYGPARRFCNQFLSRFGVETTFFDPCIAADDLAGLFKVNTKLLYLEAPGSQTFEMQDVSALASVAKAAGVLVAMDNTWATPYLFKPLAHGVDISLMAGTKYIVGHSDVMIGTVTVTDAAFPALNEATGDLGMSVGPDDVYLSQRGLRTLSVRLRQHHVNALRVAEWLQGRDEVEVVMCPALESDPGHAIWKRDFGGASGLFAVTLKPCSDTALRAFVDGLVYFGLGASWGGYESLVLPVNPNMFRVARPWPHDGPVVRFHIGLEDPQDLIADLEAGFARLKAAE